MIYNPVIVSGGGARYKITDNSGLGFPTSAEAGEIIEIEAVLPAIEGRTITDANGREIPSAQEKSSVAFMCRFWFVMPASDVTIT